MKIIKNIFNIVFLYLIFSILFSTSLALAEAAVNIVKASAPANTPVVVQQGMKPVKYQNGSWVETTSLDKDWYDYESGYWANVEINGDKYVWIPRFTYKILDDGSVAIRWSDGKEDNITDGYSKHPAFYFGEYTGGDPSDNSNFIERNGNRNELLGIWIQKDLAKTNISDISDAFEESLSSNAYSGLPQSGIYTHMLKAGEWGALAYITNAKGNFTNNRTTLNQTGVNIGSVSEYVAGVIGKPSTAGSLLDDSYKKYRDLLDDNLTDYYGMALNETVALATSGTSVRDSSFLVRGGNLGLFGYSSGDGSGNGYRKAIAILTEELTDTIAFFDTETSVVEGDYLILGVDFDVKENWSFPEEPTDFFEETENAGDKKIVDLECIYEGKTKWHQTDLNAEVIKMICPDMSETTEIKANKSYAPGKYTLVVRVGGRLDSGEPVFRQILNMDAKIIVNELNLKNAQGSLIRIGSILNNKVRLNIYGESKTEVITKVVLKKVPTKTEYDQGESLNLSGGTIVPYLGNLAGDEIPLSSDNIKDEYKNITDTPGTHKVELKYGDLDIIQEEGNEYIIEVSNVKQLVVYGRVEATSGNLSGQLRRGQGRYLRGSTNKVEELTAYEMLSGYLFSSWSSDSTVVKAANSQSFDTTYTVPSKSATLDKDEVTITANYIPPTRLEVVKPKKEFIEGEDFSLGEGKLVAVYNKNGTEVSKDIPLGTAGLTITIKDENGNEVEQEELACGNYEVTFELATKTAQYDIEVITTKYSLGIYTASTDYGEVSGYVNDTKGIQKATFSLTNGTNATSEMVSCGNYVYLEAEAKSGYEFVKWTIEATNSLGKTEDELKEKTLYFQMPQEDVIVNAEFSKAYTVTFKIKDGQSEYGSLSGELSQKVLDGKATSIVTAEANSNYVFEKWTDSEGRLMSEEAGFIDNAVMKDTTYIAVFEKVLTVTFKNDETVVDVVKVKYGGSAYTSKIPTKSEYVFVGWDKDLSEIKENITTYAQFVPRIKIEENKSAKPNMIDAQITGTMIEEGSLQYMISPNSDKVDGTFTTYRVDEIFTGFQGNWGSSGENFRSEKVGSSEDSSEVITISSANEKEIVRFDYILSASANAQIGITINGEKVITPAETESGTSWNSFEREITVINGEIKIGLSYSQGTTYTENDYAAIKNLAITRKWTVIPNSYHLLIPTEFGTNYIHVKGTGSDDLTTIYRAVSEKFEQLTES